MLEITLIIPVIILIIRFPSMAELVRTGIVRSDEAARIGDKPSHHIIIIIIIIINIIIIIIIIGDKHPHQIVIIITRPYAALRTVGLHWIVEMGFRSGT